MMKFLNTLKWIPSGIFGKYVRNDIVRSAVNGTVGDLSDILSRYPEFVWNGYLNEASEEARREIAWLERDLQEHPEETEHHNNEMERYATQIREMKGLLYDGNVEVKKKEAERRFRRGMLYKDSDNLDAAIKEFNKAIRESPVGYKEARLEAARTRRMMGPRGFQKAVENYQLALIIDPVDPTTYGEIADFLDEQFGYRNAALFTLEVGSDIRQEEVKKEFINSLVNPRKLERKALQRRLRVERVQEEVERPDTRSIVENLRSKAGDLYRRIRPGAQ